MSRGGRERVSGLEIPVICGGGQRNDNRPNKQGDSKATKPLPKLRFQLLLLMMILWIRLSARHWIIHPEHLLSRY